MKIELLRNNYRRFNKKTDKFIGRGYRLKAWSSEIYCFLRYGCSPDDYFRYEFYRKSGYERNKFITYRRSKRIIRQYNDPTYSKYFGDKCLFNEKFADFIGRAWLDGRTCSFDEFDSFVKKYGAVFLKPMNGSQGHGALYLKAEEAKKLKDTYGNYIAEEIIRQHHILAKLNSSSVNTVRILTFRGKAIAGALRIGGKGSIVDNLHSNGVCAHLDLRTGLIDAPCINNQLDKFLTHPDSGITLLGFQVPCWDEIIALAEKAAQMIPQVQYIGWDIAVTEHGAILVEGNHDPGHDVVQMIAQTGLYEKIQRMK